MRDTDFSNINTGHNWQQISELWEKFDQSPPLDIKTSSLKQKAAVYLGATEDRKLSKTEIRSLLAKANKMKTHNKKCERAKCVQLARKLQWEFNS